MTALVVMLNWATSAQSQNVIDVLRYPDEGKAYIQVDVERLGALMDSLQTELNVSSLQVAPTEISGDKKLVQFDEPAFLASVAEMRDVLGLSFTIPSRSTAFDIASIMEEILEAAATSPPAVETALASFLTTSTITLNGVVTNDGRLALEAWAFLWGDDLGALDSTHVAFTQTDIDFFAISEADTGSFALDLNALTPSHQYHYVAAAKNSKGAGYGDTLTFTTLADASAEVLDVAGHSATLKGAFTFGNVTPTETGLEWGELANLTDGSDTLVVMEQDGTISVVLEGLTEVTTYHFASFVTNTAGTTYSDTLTFTTLAVVPRLSTLAATQIAGTSSTLNAQIDATGGADVSATGFIWGEQSNLSDGVSATGSGTSGDFSSDLSGLDPNTSYYFTGFATNSAGTGYGDTLNFTTPVIRPSMTTSAATDVASTSSTLNGAVAADGGESLSAAGFVWGELMNLSDGTSLSASGTTGSFTGGLSQLTPGSTYYFAAVGTNSAGTSSGDTLSFTTPAVGPEITTVAADDLEGSSATLNGTVDFDGGAAVTATGFVWGELADLSDGASLSGSATTGAFDASLTGLVPNSTYYFTSFATNSVETTYGDTLSFTTPAVAPEISTVAADDLEGRSATLNGTIDFDGGAAVTATGFVWGELANLSDGASLSGSATTGAFDASLTGLVPNSTYYFTSFATNSAGTTYGDTLSFTTPVVGPEITTVAADDLEGSSATLNGTIDFDGGAAVTATGFVWGELANLSDGSPLSGSATTGAFDASLTGLVPNSTYYFTSFATNSVETTYGDTLSFTTPVIAPSVSTVAVSDRDFTAATLKGQVDSDGGEAPSVTGFIWGLAENLSDASTISGTAAAQGYEGALTNLTPFTTVYYAAFATNSASTAYGDTLSFKAQLPACVNTASVDYYGETYNLVEIGDQCWFQQSLQNTLYADGSAISASAYRNPNNDVANSSTMGRLYQWSVVSNEGGVCPSGYHVPSDDEVIELRDELKTEPIFSLEQNAMVASQLRAEAPAWDGNNATGFSALPAGLISWGAAGDFGAKFYMWTSTLSSPGFAKKLELNSDYFVCCGGTGLSAYYSVRCLRDPLGAPEVTTAAATNVVPEGGTLSGTAEVDPNVPLSAVGFKWGTAADLIGATDAPVSGVASAFSIDLSGLTIDTDVYYCAYATNVYGTTYGDTLMFTTGTAPEVTTLAADDLEGVSATLNGLVDFDGGPNVIGTGFIWGQLADLSDTSSVVGTLTASNFDASLTGLSPNSTYYFAGFATNNLGTSYGDTLSFTTPVVVPDVSTLAATERQFTSGQLNGNVDSDGGEACSETGLIWGYEADLSDGTSVAGSSLVDAFDAAISGLTPLDTIYFVAFATNSAGTSHGDTLNFVTELPPCGNATSVDYHGETYGLVEIGDQCWFSESLRSMTYADGTPMNSTDYRVPNQDIANVHMGSLYPWTVAVSEHGACPAPFHIPSSSEFAELRNAYTQNGTFNVQLAVSELTAAPPAWNGNNASGFNAYPSGIFYSLPSGWFVEDFGTRFKMWTTTPSVGVGQAMYGELASNTFNYTSGTATWVHLALRCLRDPLEAPTVVTAAASGVDVQGGTLNATAETDALLPLMTSGFKWGLQADLSDATDVPMAQASETMSAVLSGLSIYTDVYFTAYASNMLGLTYGDTLMFTTGTAPEMLTNAATAITDSGAQLNGTVDFDGGPAVTATGFIWGEQANLSDGDTISMSATEGSFNALLSELAHTTTYYYTVFGTNNIGTANGEILSFTTLATTPTVSTGSATDVQGDAAVLNGSVDDDGGDAVTSTGFVWGLQEDLSDGTSVNGTAGEEDSFNAAIANLTPLVPVYYSCFAVNGIGTTHGDTLSFTPAFPACENESNVDYHGDSYGLVEIGDQCWFQQSLRTTMFADGTAIPSNSMSEPNGDPANIPSMGRLYQWSVVDNSVNVCPTGYHVPSSAELLDLQNELTNNQPIMTTQQGIVVANQLKAESPAWNGNNATGFSALPSGYIVWGNVYSFDESFEMWSSTFYGTSGATSVARALTLSSVINAGATHFADAYLSIRCLKDAPGIPVVTTAPAQFLHPGGGTISGSTYQTLNTPLTEVGLKFGSLPDLSDATAHVLSSPSEDFSHTITGLSEGDTIYYVAYAVNNLGTTFGDTLSFEASFCQKPTFDGYTYEVEQIDGQCWFTENLQTEHYENGDAIAYVTEDADWTAASSGAQTVFDWWNTSSGNLENYGRLYNGFAAIDERNVCPTGWHVPSTEEFNALADGFGGLSTAGPALKAKDTDVPVSWNGTNASGFTGIPSGKRVVDGNFYDLGALGAFLTTSSVDGSTSRAIYLASGEPVGVYDHVDRREGFSIRCIQDPLTAPVVTTRRVTAGGIEGGTLNADVMVHPDAQVMSSGFKYGFQANLSDGVVEELGSASESFAFDLDGLTFGDVIYYTAYATNILGTTFGDTLVFEANYCQDPTMDDYTYAVKQIGGQCWFTENLQTQHYENGDPINYVTGSSGWTGASEGAHTPYDNNNGNLENYGRLYNGLAAIDERNVCPTGWHVPTTEEFNALADGFGGSAVAAPALKAKDTDVPVSWNGTNASGFTGIPGGKRVVDGSFYDLSTLGFYWTASSVDGSTSVTRYLAGDVNFVGAYDQVDRREGFSIRCIQDPVTAPNVVTLRATDRSTTGGTLNGTASSHPNAPVTTTGFKWGSQPDLSDGQEVISGASAGEFNHVLDAMTFGEVVYFASFATNSVGTTYGDTLELLANYCQDPSWEGVTYAVKQIGNQCWFTENLSVDVYSNMDIIPEVTDGTEWSNKTEGAMTFYDNNNDNWQLGLGRLYNGYVAVDERNVCPTGWHVPSTEEFNTLADGFGGSTVAAPALKAKDTDAPVSWNGTNASGFTGIPSGKRIVDGSFDNLGTLGFYWTRSSVDGSTSVTRYLAGDVNIVGAYDQVDRREGFSIRCIQDPVTAPTVTTLPSTSWTPESGTLNASASAHPLVPITAYGFKAGMASDLSDGIVYPVSANSSGNFSQNLEGLLEGDVVYFTAFATNVLGTTFGDTLSFVASFCNGPTTGGITYEVVEIGDQCWFAENLQTEHYANGDPITYVTEHANWSGASAGAQTVFDWWNTSSGNLENYGRLYNGFAAIDERNVCPTGWHVPSTEEFNALVNGFGGSSSAGPALKAKDTDVPVSWDGTNASGFTGTPGGKRVVDGNFYDHGVLGCFLTSSSVDGSTSSVRYLSSGEDFVGAYDYVDRREGFSIRCLQDPITAPIVTTLGASNRTDVSATLNGSALDGGLAMSSVGFIWGYTSNLIDAEMVDTDAAESFNDDLNNLTTGATVYYAAFATNYLGTSYGDTLSFIVEQEPCNGITELTYNGFTYHTVGIGNQCWFVENLRTANYNDESPIPTGVENAQWPQISYGAVTVYDEGGSNETNNLENYGRLYNWHAVNTGNLCPTGWRVPTRQELLTLVDGLGGENVAGGVIKASPEDSPSWNGTNTSGFSGLPSGYRDGNGNFSSIGSAGNYWSSTENPIYTNKGFFLSLSNYGPAANIGASPKYFGFPVRCVID